MRIAIVVCGRMGSGKSRAVRSLCSQYSFRMVSFGDYVRHEASIIGATPNRMDLQNLGEGLHRTLGARGFLRRVLEFAGVQERETAVFDGVRHSGILEEIRALAKATLAVYLAADDLTRYRRLNCRLSGDLDLQEFFSMELHSVEAQVESLKEHCDLVIDASRPITEVRQTLVDQVCSFTSSPTANHRWSAKPIDLAASVGDQRP